MAARKFDGYITPFVLLAQACIGLIDVAFITSQEIV